ncbi:ArfGap-domain-containing protein [Polychaeton citri CBS 116435]|uniref:ArfGap-domain-containing protein n=1 Tax=Polychaeton citri CBS 116435 TaxID=1314669 RepID=A0A9P4Q268_9PEZI|nr:ArfGap-domain-containing protein [Polychaeton citri CBS 116435]
MSRRGQTSANNAEANRATLKNLVKLDANKTCADCKRNKHPRWASWNIGVFICIRCSGIHRGMGTHISRVKSVDLDSWTDEQMASMIRWGNARANKYWESKLAEGHVPNEAKIENFIRTKYDSKRWTMDGPIPDPSTLDDGDDDDVPLNVVREKAQRERAASLRNGGGSAGISAPPSRPKQPMVDLFGDDMAPPPAQAQQPARPNTTDPPIGGGVGRQPPPVKAAAAPPRQTKPGESLLGLDFFGSAQTAPPARAASASPAGGMVNAAPARNDLKQSILSLYASKPAPQPQQQPAANAFGGFQSPPLTSPTQQNTQSLGGFNDAFASLSFGQPQQPSKPAPFSNLTSPSTSHSRQSSFANKTSSLSGGSFFDPPPAKPSPAPASAQKARAPSNDFGDFGAFSSAPSPVTSTKSPPPPQSSVGGAMGDLFDLSNPTPPPPPKKTTTTPLPAQTQKSQSSYTANSAFNLSTPAPAPAPKATAAASVANATTSSSGLNNMDAWGSNDVWSTPDPAPKPAPALATAKQTISKISVPLASPPTVTTSKPLGAFDTGDWGDAKSAGDDMGGWTSAPPAAAVSGSSGGPGASGASVQQDDEFGGWSHASPVAATSGPKQGGVGGNQDDLFGNVWQ